VDKRGAYYRFNDEMLGQGRENAKQFLVENPDVARQIEIKLRELASIPSTFAVKSGILADDDSPTLADDDADLVLDDAA
jgi:recombination protein RecA